MEFLVNINHARCRQEWPGCRRWNEDGKKLWNFPLHVNCGNLSRIGIGHHFNTEGWGGESISSQHRCGFGPALGHGGNKSKICILSSIQPSLLNQLRPQKEVTPATFITSRLIKSPVPSWDSIALRWVLLFYQAMFRRVNYTDDCLVIATSPLATLSDKTATFCRFPRK